MELFGFVRPDGSLGIRNHLCLVSADAGSDAVCLRVAGTVRGAVPLLYRRFSRFAGVTDINISELIGKTASNPNVGAIIVVESSSDNSQADYIVEQVAKTGRLAEKIHIGNCGGIVKASAAVLSTAITMTRDISTYRRELVRVDQLNAAMWFTEKDSTNMSLAITNCINRLVEKDCEIIRNEVMPEPEIHQQGTPPNSENRDFINQVKDLALSTEPKLRLISSKSHEYFEELAVAQGIQVQVVTIGSGNVPDHPLVPTVRVTSNRDYFELMHDTVELRLGDLKGGDMNPEDAGLLVLNELLATCSGRLSKCEIANEISL